MRRINKSDIALLLIQVVAWGLLVFVPPLVVFLNTHDSAMAKGMTAMLFNMLKAPFLIYIANFYVLEPVLFNKRRFWLFALSNGVLLGGLNYGVFYIKYWVDNIPSVAVSGLFSGIFIYLLLNIFVIAMALFIRHAMRTRRVRQLLQEERAKNAEAELAWLKNQINPHFLFNTLNNISSLTQVDPDRAQDVIAQLSDLLRYAMYETQKPLVSLGGEVAFIKDYIDLMSLRCNEQTMVHTDFAIEDDKVMVAPLLFISLVENAFKHGVSSNNKSLVKVSMSTNAGLLVFACDNTDYHKDNNDRSGSGIGIENTKRRLELAYHGRYQWQQYTSDGMYHVKISIKL